MAKKSGRVEDRKAGGGSKAANPKAKKPGRVEDRNKGGRPKVENPKPQVISLRGCKEWPAGSRRRR